jgi:hypothetical protein
MIEYLLSEPSSWSLTLAFGLLVIPTMFWNDLLSAVLWMDAFFCSISPKATTSPVVLLFILHKYSGFPISEHHASNEALAACLRRISLTRQLHH